MKLRNLKKLTPGEIIELPDEVILRSIFNKLGDCYTTKEIENKLNELVKSDYKKKSCLKTISSCNLFINIDLKSTNKFVLKDFAQMSEEEIIRCVVRKKNNASEFENFQELQYKHISSIIINELCKMGLSKDIIDKCQKYLNENSENNYEGDRYILNLEKLSTVEKLEMNIDDKIKKLSNQKLALKLIATTVSMATVTGATSGIILYNRSMLEKYENTKIIYDNMSHNIGDVFAVYNKDKVYYCTRQLYKITESEKIAGNFVFGFGSIDQYYYRDDIYDYYDIKTGEKICQDHQDGFYIENLYDIYDIQTADSHNYKINLEDLEEERNIDYLLSNKPSVKIKK